MPLRVEVPKGRAAWYIRGTIRAGKRTGSVYESTGIGAGDPRGRSKAEQVKRRREPELIQELLADHTVDATFAEAAADYGDTRKADRVARNPALATQPDKEMEYVAKWTLFLRGQGLADLPLRDMCAKIASARVEDHALRLYFDEHHVAKGHKPSTMQREATVFYTVMNHAVTKGWADKDYPRCPIPEFSILDQPVNKWLYEAEIQLFVKFAPRHLELFVAGVFATGRRGGELIFCSRRPPNYSDPNSTGLSLEPGHEHIFLGYTKTKKPIIRALPDWYIAMLKAYLAGRDDDYDALFLTGDGAPYVRPRKQRGFIMKTAWKGMRRRVVAVIERLARLKLSQGDKDAADYLRGRAAICTQVTPHWGRHNAVSHMMMKGSKRDAQRAGGHTTDTMLRRYEHLSPEASKAMANKLDFGFSGAIKVHSSKKAS